MTAKSGGIVWLPDNKRFLFLSEKTGWMQLYALDVTAATPQPKALTTGKWEITDARLSGDRRTVYLTTNEVHPGERQFYTLLNKLSEALLQLSDGDVQDAEEIVAASLRKLDDFVPRFRGLNVEALREDFRRVVVELREVRAGRKADAAPSRLPRLRILPE